MDTKEQYQDGRVQELIEMLKEKEQLVKQLIERCQKQERKVTKMMVQQGEERAKKIPFGLFKQFLKIGVGKQGNESHICFRIKAESIKGKEPIWVSSNMQLINSEVAPSKIKTSEVLLKENGCSSIGIQKMESKKQQKYQSQLSKDVQQLKQNIDKCQNMLTNLRQLKEIKEMDSIEKEQEQKLFTPNKGERKVEMNSSSALKATIKELEGQLYKLTVSNQKLREKVTKMQEAEAQYLSVIQELQQKIGKGSKLDFSSLISNSKLDKSGLRKKEKNKKTILINY